MKKTKRLCPECGNFFFTTAGARKKCYTCSPSTSTSTVEIKDEETKDDDIVPLYNAKKTRQGIAAIIAEEYENKPANEEADFFKKYVLAQRIDSEIEGEELSNIAKYKNAGIPQDAIKVVNKDSGIYIYVLKEFRMLSHKVNIEALPLEKKKKLLAVLEIDKSNHFLDQKEYMKLLKEAIANEENQKLADQEVSKKTIEHDAVNHPSHYTDGGIEVISFIEYFNLTYHRGNAVKYIVRAGKKDPNKKIEDIQKAIWYLDRELSVSKLNKGFFDEKYCLIFFEAKKLGYLQCKALISIIKSTTAKEPDEYQQYFREAIEALQKYVDYLRI